VDAAQGVVDVQAALFPDRDHATDIFHPFQALKTGFQDIFDFLVLYNGAY